MAKILTPERQRLIRPARRVVSRRRLIHLTGLAGGAALLLPRQVLAGTPASGELPKDASGTVVEGQESYTGPIYGHAVSWDPDTWQLTSAGDPDAGDEYDFAWLDALPMDGNSMVEHAEVALDDLADAEEGALDDYISFYGMTRDDAEVLQSWTSDEAVGTLFYWLGYDDIPYTYVEYAPTSDKGVWSVTNIQSRANSWDAEVAVDLYERIWIDDVPAIRAADVPDILGAIDDDIG